MPLIASFLVITTRTYEAFNPTICLLAYQDRTPGKKDRKKEEREKKSETRSKLSSDIATHL